MISMLRDMSQNLTQHIGTGGSLGGNKSSTGFNAEEELINSTPLGTTLLARTAKLLRT
jgi:hypothetical protein